MFRRDQLWAAVAAIVILFDPTAAGADTPAEFPTKPITLIVPWQASVTADLLLRGGPKGIDPVIAKKLHDAFKLAYEDPKVIELYDKFEFSRRYMNSSFVPKLVESEKFAVGKIGLARKD